jgi:lipopolysaccharide exporter
VNKVISTFVKNDSISVIKRVVLGAGFGQLLVFATMPLVARIYDPSSFGNYAKLLTFIGIFSTCSCISLELSIVQSKTKLYADRLCVAAIFSSFIVSILSAFILVLFVWFDFLSFGKFPAIASVMVALMVFLNGLYVAVRYRTLREQNYNIIIRSSLSQNTMRAFAPIAWATLFPMWLGLLLGELTGRFFGVRAMFFHHLPNIKKTRMFGNFKSWWQLVCREKKYTLFLTLTIFIDVSASLIIPTLLDHSFSSKIAGEYFLVLTFLTAPSALLGGPIADVLYAKSSALSKDSPEFLLGYFKYISLLLLLLALMIYLPIHFLSSWLFIILFGENWSNASLIAHAMTPFMIVSFVASPCSRMLFVLDKVNYKICSDIFRLAGVLLVIASFSFLKTPFDIAIQILCWFLTFAYFVYYVLSFAAVKNQAC